MKTPPFLLGCALIFWGWRIDALWLTSPMAIAIEASRWIPVRFEFTQRDLDRIWNLCVLLFAASGLVAFALSDGFDALSGVMSDNTPARRLEVFTHGATSAVRFLQYSPATLLPIVLAQAFAQQERFPWSTFSSLLRQRRRAAAQAPAAPALAEPGLNISYPFLGLVLFAATLSRETSPWFLVGLAILLGWALERNRPRTFSLTAWVTTLICALALGVAGVFGLLQLQGLLRSLDGAIMARLGAGNNFDPKGTWTRMGSIGGMKQSGQIVLRVESEGNPPPLLREASYDQFRAPVWGSSKRHFERALPDTVDSSWPLVPHAQGTSTVTISTFLPGGKGVLALPAGSVRLTDLPVFQLQTNGHGTVQIEEGPGFARFQARFRDGPSFDLPPGPEDNLVPVEEADVIRNLATTLQLDAAEPARAIEIVRSHFAGHFDYTTWLSDAHRARSNRTALAAFLLETHSGHCEYFATATTLLLRAAGIPARYAVGFAVQEKKGSHHIVRNRDAHAWTLAWMDGRWHDIDTTPGTWVAAEARRAPFWEPFYDLISRAWFEFSLWRWSRSDWKRHLIWLVIPLVGFAAFRILQQKQWRRFRANPGRPPGTAERPGRDSELYEIERRLRQLGLEREPGETMAAWLHRASRHPLQPITPEQGEELRNLHYQLRFDPPGLAATQRARLRSVAAQIQSQPKATAED